MGNRHAIALALSLCACASAGSGGDDDPGGGGGGFGPDGGPGAIADAAPLPPDACGDSDGDGVCNGLDACEGHDDAIDADADTVADGCDRCPSADDRVDVNANATPDCVETQTRTINLKVAGGNMWRGWHSSAGTHDSGNDNTITGLFSGISTATYNSYFVFSLAGVTAGTITGVTLELELEAYQADASETFSVWDVSTASTTLEASGSNTTIFNDLQAGNQYATKTVTLADRGQILSIPLSAQAATDVKAKLGSDFAVGVHVDTPPGWIRFGNTPDANDYVPTVQRLTITYLP